MAPALDHRHAIIGPPPSPDGWIRAADLLEPAALDAALAVIREYHEATPEVAVSYFTAWYAATIVGPAIAMFVLARRVPDLDPAGLSVHRHEGGWFDATAFHHPRAALLTSDPAAPDPADSDPAAPDPADSDPAAPDPADSDLAGSGAVEPTAVVADVDALRRLLVARIIGHLEPVISTLRSRARLGPAALWGAVASQCGRTFLLTERVSRDPHAGREEADAFFADAAPTLRARPTWQQFVHHGRPYTGMRRGSCCLAHRLTEEFCTACPFVRSDERESRLRQWIDSQGPGGLAV
ncbi:ferric iron reductase [Frankia sp. EI5c]|uniref:ferric iron reductase n=1 Tax=Frankia sp. EI5c TaxID=683316 RepID=UPI001F5BA741|nr:ferric iron reductase [Frankia sp. EI5c]